MGCTLIIAGAIAADAAQTVAGDTLRRLRALLRKTETTRRCAGGGGSVTIEDATITLLPLRHDAVTAGRLERGSGDAFRRTTVSVDRIAIITLLIGIERGIPTARESNLLLASLRTTITVDRIAIVTLLPLCENPISAGCVSFLSAGVGATIAVDGIAIIALFAGIETTIAAESDGLYAGAVSGITNVALETDAFTDIALLSLITTTVAAEGRFSPARTSVEVAGTAVAAQRTRGLALLGWFDDPVAAEVVVH